MVVACLWNDAADRPLPNGCGYTYYEGTCRGEPEGMFHFFGIIDGRLASFPGNEIEHRDVVLKKVKRWPLVALDPEKKGMHAVRL